MKDNDNGKKESSIKEVAKSFESESSAIRSNERQEEGFKISSLLMGDHVFLRLQDDKVFPAIVTSDGANDKKVDLVYFDGNSGRTAAVKRCVYGTEKNQWWHNSKELITAIEFERQIARVIPETA